MVSKSSYCISLRICFINLDVSIPTVDNKELPEKPLNEDKDDDYEFVNRTQYGSLPSKTTLKRLSLPVETIVIGRTKTAACASYVRNVEVTRFRLFTR